MASRVMPINSINQYVSGSVAIELQRARALKSCRYVVRIGHANSYRWIACRDGINYSYPRPEDSYPLSRKAGCELDDIFKKSNF